MDHPDIRGIIRRSLFYVFITALVVGVGGFYLLLRDEATQSAEQQARILLSSALAIRHYTVTHITGNFAKLPGKEFHEETVPSFAAQTVFRSVTAGGSAYSYHEPTLNPTSSADRPTPFGVELIERFRADPSLKELNGTTAIGGARVYYLAHPIRIDDPACLVCHDTPQRAPAALIAKYGSGNGFGWKLHEIVGAQLATVPVTQEFRNTLQLAAILGGGVTLIFALAYFALSTALDTSIVRPLDLLARRAETASRSAHADALMPTGGAREVRVLSDAIERLRISLTKAMTELRKRGEEK